MSYIQSNWSGGIAEWTEGNTAFVSGVFSWNKQKVFMRCVYYREQGYQVRCGGQVVQQYPELFSEFYTDGFVDALKKHNSEAVFTSRGCIRKCSFCIVPKMEGKLIELEDWEAKPIICDNNLLATTTAHFDRVIDKLLVNNITKIDFNQGLDTRLLTDHHASRLSKLPKDTIIRLAWDNTKLEQEYFSAFEKLINAGINQNQVRTYVLIGYKDSPEDALYRLSKIEKSGVLPNPMRYQPIDCLKKNSYVESGWSNQLLNKFIRYWSNTKLFRGFSFEEYTLKKEIIIPENQLDLL